MNKQFIIAMFFIFSPPLMAQDLIDIYNLALKNDAELQIAEAGYQATRESLPIAESALKPMIDLSAQHSQRKSDAGGGNRSNTTGYSLRLMHPLYNAQTPILVNSVESQLAQAAAKLEVSRQALIVRVAERYFDALAAQDGVEFSIAEKNAIARQLEQAKKRFEVGLIAITDVHEAQALYDSAEAKTILAENLLDNAFQALTLITAQPTTAKLARLGDKIDLTIPQPADSQQWAKISLKNNQSLVAAQAASRAAKFELERKSKGHYPTVNLSASYADNRFNSDTFPDSNDKDLTLALQLNVPLYTGGRTSAEKRQAAANYLSAQNAALLQRRLTTQQTITAYLGVNSGISQVQALKQALESNKTALEATEAGFDVGTRTSVDVLISLRETFRAQLNYASARYDFLINTLRLKQAAGLLSRDDLAKVNSWLVR